MASAAIHGRVALLYVGATPTLVGELRDVTLTVERETTDVTSHDTVGWREHIYSLATWSMSAEALFIDADAGQVAVHTALDDETILAIEFRPEGTGSGKTKWTGSGLITSFNPAHPNDEAAALSIEIMGSGAVVKGTQT